MSDQFRVTTWDDYQGQNKMKKRLETHIQGSLNRGDALDHLLLVGPPGCGKTTIAEIIAAQMYAPFVSFVMPQKPNLLRRVFQEHEGVVLLDEIHRLKASQQETLLTVIEDGYYQMDNGGRIDCNESLTVIGATTEPDKIIAPLYDRFTIRPEWEVYTDREMGKIIQGMAERADVDLSRRVCKKLARATGGVPRNGKMMVVMARDMYSEDPDEILTALRLTKDGLTVQHLDYLQVLSDTGKPTGLTTIRAHLRLPESIIYDLERLLLRRKLITYETTGRDLTGAGMKVVKENKATPDTL